MLPKGSVLALILFNIYTNDQSHVPDIRRFFHAEDLFITTVRLLRENRGDTLRRLVSSPTITDSGTLIPTPVKYCLPSLENTKQDINYFSSSSSLLS